MAFDKALDKELFSETAEFETSKITVGVYSYNDGDKKLQLSRKALDQETGEPKWAKLGRMNKDELTAVIPLMGKALEVM